MPSFPLHCHYCIIVAVSSLSQCPCCNVLVTSPVVVEHEPLGSLTGRGGRQAASGCVEKAIGPIDILGDCAGGGIKQTTLVMPSSPSCCCYYIMVTMSSLS